MALADSTNPMQGVSGPGKFAKRTDLEFQPQAYGEGVEMSALKAGAPLATAPKSPLLSQAPQVAPAQAGVTGLFEPSGRPNEPITHGVDAGPGAGSEALMMNQISQDDKDIVAKYLPSLTAMANAQDTPQSFRAFVSFLQGSL